VNAGIYYLENSDVIDKIKINDDFGLDVFPKLLDVDYDIFGLKTQAQLIAIDTPALLAENLG